MSCEERTKVATRLLTGKTIKGVAVLNPPLKIYWNGSSRQFDDENRLVLEFTDGTSAEIVASFGDYSPKALDGEYPAYIDVYGRL